MELYFFKILLAGDGAVGKTSIVQRLIKRKFVIDYKATIGVDVFTKNVKIKENDVKLTIWDIAGQEQYNFMRDNFYYGTDGVLLIFDLTREKTFENITGWVREIHQALGDDVPYILIGNKVDLIEDVGDVVDHDQIIEFAERKNIIYRETSAKTGLNIDIVFEDLTRKIIKNRTHDINMFGNMWGKKK